MRFVQDMDPVMQEITPGSYLPGDFHGDVPNRVVIWISVWYTGENRKGGIAYDKNQTER